MTKNGRDGKHSCIEWIQLFVSFLIPTIIAVYTVLENNRDLSIAARNRAQDLDIADNQQKDLIVSEYQKTISKLIEKYGSQLNESESIPVVARFATLSTLNQLDTDRRRFLIRLLYDAKLITYHTLNDLSPISLESVNLMDLSLVDGSTEQTLTHLFMEGTILSNAHFHGINLEGGRFNRAILNNADFSNTTNICVTDDISCSTLNDPSLYFESTDLTNASFFGSIYENATFYSSKMKKINLNSFQCISCILDFALIDRADLTNVVMEKSSFAFVRITDSKLDRSNFGNNVDFYGGYISKTSANHIHLKRCSFEYASLRNVTLDYATIEDSSFFRAQFYGISMQHSVLININFTYANLIASNWGYVRCEKCIFFAVDFTDTDLSNAIFIDCDFTNSTISENQIQQAISFNGSILPDEIQINST